jgi:hypothetical protein
MGPDLPWGPGAPWLPASPVNAITAADPYWGAIIGRAVRRGPRLALRCGMNR